MAAGEEKDRGDLMSLMNRRGFLGVSSMFGAGNPPKFKSHQRCFMQETEMTGPVNIGLMGVARTTTPYGKFNELFPMIVVVFIVATLLLLGEICFDGTSWDTHHPVHSYLFG